MPHISKVKLIRRWIFQKNLCWKWLRKTSSKSLFVFQKRFVWWCERKKSAHQIQYVLLVFNLDIQKKKLYEISDCWFRDMFNLAFLEKGLELVSWSCFVYDLSRKIFPLLCFVNYQMLLSDCHYFFSNGQYLHYNPFFPVYDVINSENELGFFI